MSGSSVPALLVLAVLGLVIGSFLNVVVHRVPAGLSVVAPPSSCPACCTLVRARDNIPVLSWVLLRARCRDCSAPIHVRYPAVEAATGALFVLGGAVLGLTPYLVAVLAVTAAGVALFVIDLEHQRLPFSITAVGAGAAVAALGMDVVVRGPGPVPSGLLSSLLWFAVYGGTWWATAGRGMGLGDVALAPVLGLVLGWSGWGPSLVGLLGGFVLGAVVGVGLLLTRRVARGVHVPHGPSMLVGAALALVAGEPLWQDYLSLVGLA